MCYVWRLHCLVLRPNHDAGLEFWRMGNWTKFVVHRVPGLSTKWTWGRTHTCTSPSLSKTTFPGGRNSTKTCAGHAGGTTIDEDPTSQTGSSTSPVRTSTLSRMRKAQHPDGTERHVRSRASGCHQTDCKVFFWHVYKTPVACNFDTHRSSDEQLGRVVKSVSQDGPSSDSKEAI